VILSEHRLQRLRCPQCGAVRRAELPAGVPPGAFGSRLQAAIATLSMRNRVSRRDAVEHVGELFGAALSTSSIDAIAQRTARALEEPYEELLGHIREAAGAARRGALRRRLLGPLVGLRLPRCGATSALLGTWSGTSPPRSEGLGAQKQSGEEGLQIAGRLFAAWGEFREDGDRGLLLESVGPLQEELRALLEEAARKSTKTRCHRTFAKNLLEAWPALWTFAGVPGVEPTNNHAERSLRGAVICRKLSLGSQSEGGERTIERLLSASVTCRLQKRSLFAYLSDVLAAKIRDDPVPLLSWAQRRGAERLQVLSGLDAGLCLAVTGRDEASRPAATCVVRGVSQRPSGTSGSASDRGTIRTDCDAHHRCPRCCAR
jgi:transposase